MLVITLGGRLELSMEKAAAEDWHTGARGAGPRPGDGASSAADLRLRRGGPCLRPASPTCLMGPGISTQPFLTPLRVRVASVKRSSDTPNPSVLLPSSVIHVL